MSRPRPVLRPESWPQEPGQDDKWSFCLTAGTPCPANKVGSRSPAMSATRGVELSIHLSQRLLHVSDM